MRLSYRAPQGGDLKNEGDILEEIALKLIDEPTSNRLVLVNELRKRGEYFRGLYFNFAPVLARSKKFNMQMTQFDRDIAEIFGVKPQNYEFSAIKFLRQIAELPLFQMHQNQMEESSSSDDDGRRVKMRRAAIRSESFEPAEDRIFSEIARMIDPETDILVEYHEVMLEDVLFAVEEVDEKAECIGSLFSLANDLEICENSGVLNPEPHESLAGVARRISLVVCGIELKSQMRYDEGDFTTLLAHLTRYRQMLEQVLHYWPFRHSFSFLFARALESDLFFIDNEQIKLGIEATRQEHLNWYMNSVKNLLFPSFTMHFNGFEHFLTFFDNIFKTIPSAEFEQTIEAVAPVSISEIFHKSRRHLVIRNELNQEISFAMLEKHVGYNLVIAFKILIRERFTAHISKELPEFPFTFLYKLAQKFFDAKVVLSERFPVIKQKEMQTESELLVSDRINTAAFVPLSMQKTTFNSKMRKQGSILATNMFLELFCSSNFDDVKSEFLVVEDFVSVMERLTGRDISRKMMLQYKIEPFLVLNSSEELYFHYQEFLKPNQLVVTRNMLINVFKGAIYASEEQNIQVLVELNYELQGDDLISVQQVLSRVFALRVDQIAAPVFFLFQLFVVMRRCQAKLKYLVDIERVQRTRSEVEMTRPRSIELTLRREEGLNEQFVRLNSCVMACDISIADL